MTCNHYSPEFVTARMREREAGHEPHCPHCRLAEAERLLYAFFGKTTPLEKAKHDAAVFLGLPSIYQRLARPLRLTTASGYQTPRPSATLKAYREQLAAAIRERDEYYNRAVSLLSFVPGDVPAGQLQQMRDDFARWRTADQQSAKGQD
jgi:hypothetical protein